MELENLISRDFRISQFGLRRMASEAPKKLAADDVDLNKPIKYLESPAAQWKAQWSTKGLRDERPWFESYIVLASISVFLLYFCVLREENDIDEKLKTPLYDNVPGLEQQNLLLTHKYNVESGKSNAAIEKRMKELEMDVESIRQRHVAA